MQEFNKEVGLRIARLRNKIGLSQEVLSGLAGISAKFLYEIECGKKGMSAYTLYHIARALNVSADYILTGEGSTDTSSRVSAMLSSFTPEQVAHTECILREIRCMLQSDPQNPTDK